MKTFFATTLALAVVLLLPPAETSAADPETTGNRSSPEAPAALEAFVKRHFPARRSERDVAGLPEGSRARAVLDETGNVLGWWFRSDQMPPVVRGHKGEIAALVAVSTQERILGVEVLSHRETPSYFEKLTPAFFQQFERRLVRAGTAGLDAVTGATNSSRALIRDVMEGAAVLLQAVKPSAPSLPRESP